MGFIKKNKNIFYYVLFSLALLTALAGIVILSFKIDDLSEMKVALDNYVSNENADPLKVIYYEKIYSSSMTSWAFQAIAFLLAGAIGAGTLLNIKNKKDDYYINTSFSMMFGCFVVAIAAISGSQLDIIRKCFNNTIEIPTIILAEIGISTVGMLFILLNIINIKFGFRNPNIIGNFILATCSFVCGCLILADANNSHEIFEITKETINTNITLGTLMLISSFVGMFVGIFIPEKRVINVPTNTIDITFNTNDGEKSNNEQIVDKLKELEQLYKKHQISKQEYEETRQKLIDMF